MVLYSKIGNIHIKMADLKAVFAQFANAANEGEAASLDKKKVKRALKVTVLHYSQRIEFLIVSGVFISIVMKNVISQ